MTRVITNMLRYFKASTDVSDDGKHGSILVRWEISWPDHYVETSKTDTSSIFICSYISYITGSKFSIEENICSDQVPQIRDECRNYVRKTIGDWIDQSSWSCLDTGSVCVWNLWPSMCTKWFWCVEGRRLAFPEIVRWREKDIVEYPKNMFYRYCMTHNCLRQLYSMLSCKTLTKCTNINGSLEVSHWLIRKYSPHW